MKKQINANLKKNPVKLKIYLEKSLKLRCLV